MVRPKPERLTGERAESLALQALSFLVADATRISRFMSLTGMSPQDLRDIATSRDIQVATLEYLLSDEGLLLTFCQETGNDPAMIAPAYRLIARTGEF
jgi:hypothetical protein